MAIHLVVAEYDEHGLKKASLSALTAAQKIAGEIYGLVIGHNIKKVAQELASYIKKVHLIENESLKDPLAMPYAQAVSEVAKNINASHIWSSATVFGKDLFPRVAVRLNAGMASDIQAVLSENSFQRPLWAGDLLCEMEILTPIKVLTVRSSEFSPSMPLDNPGEVINTPFSANKSKMRFVKFDKVISERPDLSDAKVVIAGGRGLKGAEGFKELIEPLADILHGAIGASRAVCDAGWVPNDWQVGQTGKVVAPKLYIAVGISGAIQHVAGMKGSKIIVAINKDPDAPIFQIADYGLVADAFKAVPELIALLKK